MLPAAAGFDPDFCVRRGRGWRALMLLLPPAIVEAWSPVPPDKYLIFLSGFGRSQRLTQNEMALLLVSLNTWAGFTGTDRNAAIAGDLAILESKVTPVLEALWQNRLGLVTIHQRMTNDRAVHAVAPLVGS
jgi:hypothetical protein